MTSPTDTDDFNRYLAQELLIESVTEKLLELMDREGVTKAELARRLGKSRPYVTQILDGSRNMTLRTVADVAHVIGHQVHMEEGDGLHHPSTATTIDRDQVTQEPTPATPPPAADLGDAAEFFAHQTYDAYAMLGARIASRRPTLVGADTPHGRVPGSVRVAAERPARYDVDVLA